MLGAKYQVIQSPARRLFRDGFRGGVLGYVQMPLVNIDCSRIFRYVRVVKPIIANAFSLDPWLESPIILPETIHYHLRALCQRGWFIVHSLTRLAKRMLRQRAELVIDT